MEAIIDSIRNFLSSDRLVIFIRVAAVIIIGFPLIKIISSSVAKRVKKKHTQQTVMIVRKIIFLTGLGIILFSVLNELGFNLSAILGALGIFGLAIGFASQTSVSNIISGIFLLSERPFEMGDVIQIGGTVGMVLSIDLLSVKLRTFDNRFIRIPNESIIKSETVNITRFPIRRMDLEIGVAYKEDVKRVFSVLKELAANNPYCLEEPEPVIYLNEFGDSALIIKFNIWFEKSDVINLKRTIMESIKERFDAEDIEIPFPHISVYTGEATNPFPVSMKINKEEQRREK